MHYPHTLTHPPIHPPKCSIVFLYKQSILNRWNWNRWNLLSCTIGHNSFASLRHSGIIYKGQETARDSRAEVWCMYLSTVSAFLLLAKISGRVTVAPAIELCLWKRGWGWGILPGIQSDICPCSAGLYWGSAKRNVKVSNMPLPLGRQSCRGLVH